MHPSDANILGALLSALGFEEDIKTSFHWETAKSYFMKSGENQILSTLESLQSSLNKKTSYHLILYSTFHSYNFLRSQLLSLS